MTDDAITTEVLEWQTRPLCCRYLVVLFDALPVRIQEEGVVHGNAIHLALGMLADGQHEVLGLWIDPAPGTKGWPTVFKHLKDRGVENIRCAGIDGPKGLPTALHAAYPATKVQPSIAHLIRHSLSETTPRDRQRVAAALQPIHTAASAVAAQAALDVFAASPWGAKYPSIVRCWQAALKQLISFFALPRKVQRTILSAVHDIEHLHQSLSCKNRGLGCFASGQAATAFAWLALRDAMRRGRRSVQAGHLNEGPGSALNAPGRVRPARTVRSA